MGAEYIEARDGNLYIGKSRVTFETVIIRWKTGDSPEEIHKGFPSVPLAAVYGTIAYYLEHQEELDRFLQGYDEMAQAQQAAAEAANPEFYARMRQRLNEARTRRGLDEPKEAPPVDDPATETTLGSSSS